MSCQHCEAPLRARGVAVADAPGTKAPGSRGLCISCYKSHRDDYPPINPRIVEGRDRAQTAAEPVPHGSTVAAYQTALGWLHEPPGGAGWHVVRCRRCRWVEPHRVRWRMVAAGRAHAHTHINDIILESLKEYL